ncbi:hypothetical protein [Sulfitobacter sp.]|jgi:hypothetical protein|uniref:hypothetical protein n=1 Tax=Sulfitobacter sp. TaxID=1903071 RepID=UPI003001C811
MIVRVSFVLICVALLGGFYYLSYNGVWADSRDLDRSVRIGGPGGFSGGRIK